MTTTIKKLFSGTRFHNLHFERERGFHYDTRTIKSKLNKSLFKVTLSIDFADGIFWYYDSFGMIIRLFNQIIFIMFTF